MTIKHVETPISKANIELGWLTMPTYGLKYLHISNKHLDLTIYWMPSHTDSNPKKGEIAPKWMQPWHVAGNNVADTLAGASAEMNAIPETEANMVIQIYKDLSLIQNRLITVIKMMPQRATYHDKI